MSFPRVNQKTLHAAEVATDAAIILPGSVATADRRWRIRKILASYSLDTQAGTLVVTFNAQVLLEHDLVGAADLDFGPDGWQMPGPAGEGVDLLVTLAAGADTIAGHLTTIAFSE